MLKCSSSLVLLKELQGDVSLELLGGSDVESTSCWKLRVSEDDEDRLENKDNKDGFVRDTWRTHLFLHFSCVSGAAEMLKT